MNCELECTAEAEPDLLLAGSLIRKKCGGPYYMNIPRLPSPDTHSHHRHFFGIRAAMQTTIEATQNRFLYSLIIISLFLACYHVAKSEKCAFVGATFLWGPYSAEHAEHA